jgi:hypothetical protein
MMKRVILSLALVLTLASHAFAQTTWTPASRLAFDHDNANFEVTEYYEFGYFTSLTATTPVAVVQIPKAQFTSALPEVRHALLPKPAIGTFYIRALAGNTNGKSAWSDTAAGPMIFGPDAAPLPKVPTGIRIMPLP